MRIKLTLAGLLMVTACASCSPGGAGSISVPSGKDKLKVASKIGSVKPKVGSTRPSQPAPRRP
jgi:hypothetical protein